MPDSSPDGVEAPTTSAGPVFSDVYQRGKYLGHGSVGSVYRCTNKMTMQEYAVKIIKKDKIKGHEDMVKREVDVLKTVSCHPNVAGLLPENSYFEDNDAYYLVMELCKGGELLDYILNQGTFTERDAAHIIHGVLSALVFCHNLGVVHRDLKMENLMLKDPIEVSPNMHVKVVDFGLSKIIRQDQFLQTMCGTPAFVAPEVLEGEQYGKPCDMWSVGCITYALLSGSPPFGGESTIDTCYKVIAGRFYFPASTWQDISEDAKDFIRALLVTDPNKRLTAEQALQHPWIVKTLVPIVDLSAAASQEELDVSGSLPLPLSPTPSVGGAGMGDMVDLFCNVKRLSLRRSRKLPSPSTSPPPQPPPIPIAAQPSL